MSSSELATPVLARAAYDAVQTGASWFLGDTIGDRLQQAAEATAE